MATEYYTFITSKGKYRIGRSSYEALEGPYKGTSMIEEGGPGPNYGGMVDKVIMLETYGHYKDEDQIHSYNVKENRRFKVKGSDKIHTMKKSGYYLHTSDVRDIVWWETYKEWCDREIVNKSK